MLAAAGSHSATAQTASKGDAMQACQRDYKNYCAGVIPGGGRILKCLSGHMQELAPQCKDAVAMGEVCLPDYQKFCGSIQPGSSEGQLMACMSRNADKLSPACRKIVEPRQSSAR